MPGLLVGPGEHKTHIGHRRIVNPDLATIQIPAIAVLFGDSANARNIRAGFRLGDAIGSFCCRAQQIRQPSGALCIGPMPDKQSRNQFDETTLICNGSVATRQFFHDQRVSNGIKSRAAHFLWHANAEKAELSHLPVDVRREGLFAVKLFGNRTNDVIGKLPRHFPDLGVGFRDKQSKTPVTV